MLPSLPKISCPTKGTVTRTDVAFYFMPGAEQWYIYQRQLLWHPFTMTKFFDGLALNRHVSENLQNGEKFTQKRAICI
jgi:hypothetical protein